MSALFDDVREMVIKSVWVSIFIIFAQLHGDDIVVVSHQLLSSFGIVNEQ